MKKVTTLTPEGYVIQVGTGYLMGWKCQQCSTSFIADKAMWGTEQAEEYVVAMYHDDCQN